MRGASLSGQCTDLSELHAPLLVVLIPNGQLNLTSDQNSATARNPKTQPSTSSPSRYLSFVYCTSALMAR